MKTAFDVTIVYVDEGMLPANLGDLMSDLMANRLVYYGDYAYAGNGKPIIYLCQRGYKAAPTPDTNNTKEE